MKTLEYYFPMICGPGASVKVKEICKCLEDLYHEYSLHGNEVTVSQPDVREAQLILFLLEVVGLLMI